MTDTKATRGRPRGFDKDAGIAIAQKLFDTHGYDNVGVADLCTSLGVKPPSLYAAYGSKRGLFDQAVASYLAQFYDELSPVIAAAETAKGLRRDVLTTSITRYCAHGHGCLVLSNMTSIGDADLRAGLTNITENSRTAMQNKLEQLGLSPKNAKDQTMAISVAMMGYSAAARSGVPREALLSTLDV